MRVDDRRNDDGGRTVPTLADLAERLKRRSRARMATRRAARLPALILMSDTRRLPDPERALSSLPRGSAVIFRHYDAPDRAQRARRLVARARARGVRVLIAGDARLAAAVGADGVHLPEGLARRGPGPWPCWRRKGWLVTAAAHSRAALFRAARIGADAALLGPVFPTASHPERPALGALLLARLARTSPLPVVALGGISLLGARRLKDARLVGIAGISGLTATARMSRPEPGMVPVRRLVY
jgi:thiamine-phosphate pyrophosphorylase